jgi:hypothetical protein
VADETSEHGIVGTERVVSCPTEELDQLGHDVTLFASGDSETRGTIVPGLRARPACTIAISAVASAEQAFDERFKPLVAQPAVKMGDKSNQHRKIASNHILEIALEAFPGSVLKNTQIATWPWRPLKGRCLFYSSFGPAIVLEWTNLSRLSQNSRAKNIDDPCFSKDPAD